MERASQEDDRRARERQIMDEGLWVKHLSCSLCPLFVCKVPLAAKEERGWWYELQGERGGKRIFQDEDVWQVCMRIVRFSTDLHVITRPGHGAPTVDNRKKRFTEHQFDKLRHNNPDMVTSEEFRPPPPPSYSRFHHDEPDNTVSATIKQFLSKAHKCFCTSVQVLKFNINFVARWSCVINHIFFKKLNLIKGLISSLTWNF